MKKYAFVLMGAHYDPSKHHATFDTAVDMVSVRTVRSMREAEETVRSLYRDGYGAIELCGAFGPDAAARLTDLTNGEVAIGYVVHDPKLDPVFAAFFGGNQL